MIQNAIDRPVTEGRGYFARFFGLARALGVNGFGGEFNSVRSRSSVRFSASPRGSKSSDSGSLARFAPGVSLRLVIAGV
jgi:hypothetical protein